jgi:hypothetical protein
MFKKLENSWELAKASWRVLQADKELMIFPIVSFFASLLVLVTFAVPSFLAGIFDSVVAGNVGIMGALVGFAFYTVMYFVTFFMNAALVGAAMIRLEGGDPTVGDGFRIALDHVSSILGYALISATVGMILRWFSERAGVVGRIVVSLIGFTWNVATYLVVPVLVMEKVGPVDAVKRSGSLLKQTWGEQLVGNFGIGTVFGWIGFLVFLLGGGFVALAIATGSAALIVTAVLLTILMIIAVALINTTLKGIYTAAVYQYAATGETAAFDPAMIKNAFKQK